MSLMALLGSMIDANLCLSLSAVRFHFGDNQLSFVRLVLEHKSPFSLPGAQSQSPTPRTLPSGFPLTAPIPLLAAARLLHHLAKLCCFNGASMF